MALTNHGELKTAVANWLEDSNQSSRIPEFIALAEDRIAQDLRVRDMETEVDLTISSEDTSLPSGFLEARRLYLNTNPKKDLTFVTPHHMADIWASSQTGEPDVFTIEGGNLRVGPIPDSSYTGKLLYYKRYDALSGDSDTNWIFSNARGLYLYASCLEGSIFLENDTDIAKYSQLYGDILKRVNDAERRGRYTGGPLVMRSGIIHE